MAKKSFAFGMGTGILILVIIFNTIYGIEIGKYKDALERKAITEEAEITDAEVIEKALELGMVFTPSASPSATPVATPVETPSATPIAIPVATPIPVAPSISPIASAKAAPTPTAKPGTVKVTIPNGASAKQIANVLKAEGVIDDADKFIKYLSDNGYDKKIATGNKILTIGSTYEQVAKDITR